MAKSRSYRLLCPIAKALDRIGDRWTLLILRDLLAGPARFSELQRGLTGIAANLLTERLVKLVDDGLVAKTSGSHGTVVYALTEAGLQTSDILFELARFGARLDPGSDLVAPGNLRTVAATLGAAARRVATEDMTFRAAVVVDDEEMELAVDRGRVDVAYGPVRNPELVFTTGYADLLSASEGELPLDVFLSERSRLEVLAPRAEPAFQALMTGIFQSLID